MGAAKPKLVLATREMGKRHSAVKSDLLPGKIPGEKERIILGTDNYRRIRQAPDRLVPYPPSTYQGNKPESQNMFDGIKGLFKKRNLQDIAHGLRSQEEVFDRRVAELGYDRKRGDRQVESIVKKGVDAALSNNLLGKREAAIELKAARAESAGLDHEMATAIKARAFVRITRRKLERSSDQSLKTSYDKVAALLDDPALKDMMLRADVSLDQFIKKIDVALSRAMDGMKTDDGFATDELDTSIFDAMADATRKGDEKKLQSLKSEALGNNERSKEEFESVS